MEAQEYQQEQSETPNKKQGTRKPKSPMTNPESPIKKTTHRAALISCSVGGSLQ